MNNLYGKHHIPPLIDSNNKHTYTKEDLVRLVNHYYLSRYGLWDDVEELRKKVWEYEHPKQLNERK